MLEHCFFRCHISLWLPKMNLIEKKTIRMRGGRVKKKQVHSYPMIKINKHTHTHISKHRYRNTYTHYKHTDKRNWSFVSLIEFWSQETSNVCQVSVGRLSSVCRMSVQYLSDVCQIFCQMYIQCLLFNVYLMSFELSDICRISVSCLSVVLSNVIPMSVVCLPNVCQLSVRYPWNVCRMSVKYLSNACQVFVKCQSQCPSVVFVYLKLPVLLLTEPTKASRQEALLNWLEQNLGEWNLWK